MNSLALFPVREVAVGPVVIGGRRPVALIAGPCVIESETACLEAAGFLRDLTRALGIPLVFKSSYDKANRSSLSSYRGPGIEKGLKILERVKKEYGVPVLSDIHRFEEIGEAATVLDALQVPAFLCRQTDFVLAIAGAGKVINVKKGQFLSPWDMRNIVEKIESTGNRSILLTERGASFGYHNLVTDLRGLVVMRETGYPVVFDVTHSLQLPGAGDGVTAGQAEYIGTLAPAGVAAGVDGVFLEIHEDPSKAKSDAQNALALDRLDGLLQLLIRIDAARRGVS